MLDGIRLWFLVLLLALRTILMAGPLWELRTRCVQMSLTVVIIIFQDRQAATIDPRTTFPADER